MGNSAFGAGFLLHDTRPKSLVIFHPIRSSLLVY